MMSISEDELSDVVNANSNNDVANRESYREMQTWSDLILCAHDPLNYKRNEFGSDIDPDEHFFNSVEYGCEYYTDDQYKSINTDGAFTVIHFNSRSLYKNYDSIKEYLSQFNKFSVIAMSETWLDEVKGSDVEIEGYQLFTVNRNRKKGGGVALFVDTNLRSKLEVCMTTTIDGIMECISVEIVFRNSKKCIISCLEPQDPVWIPSIMQLEIYFIII